VRQSHTQCGARGLVGITLVAQAGVDGRAFGQGVLRPEILKLWQRAGFSVLLVTHDVEEALFLANRVIIFSQRPAATVAELKVDLPYPRHRTQPRFVELRQQALARLGLPQQA